MLDDLHPKHKSLNCYKGFDERWEYFKQKSKYPLLRAMMSAFKCDIFFCLFL